MRIDEIAVDGFGPFRDRRIEPAPGLTLIRGANEAGKSTLLAFIRSILFGFETKSNPALAGGRRGGWLNVTTADGRRVRIERYGQTGGNGQLRLLDDDGNDLGPDLLPRILQGVERSVYTNVFAFGLAELAQISNLSTAEVAARIYGAGMGTGATSVVEVENRLEKARQELFAKQGRNPRINVLLGEIDGLNSQIEALDPPALFRAAGNRRDALQAELAELSLEAEALAVERHRLERLRDAWAAWVGLGSARARLAELPPAPAGSIPLPADVLERLGLAEHDLATARTRAEELDRDRAQAIAERDAAAVDETLLAERAEAEALLAGLPEARADRTRLADLQRDRAEREAALGDALRRLGAGWTEARLLAVDDSIGAHGAISGTFRTSLEAAEREVEASRAQAAALDQGLLDARDGLAAVDQAPAPSHWEAPADSGLQIGLVAAVALGVTVAAATALLGLSWSQAGVLVLLAAAGGLVIGVLVRRRGQVLAPSGAAVASLSPIREERLDRVRVLEQRARSAAERQALAAAALAQAQAAWQAWLTEHGLPADLDRETAGRMLDSAGLAKASLTALQSIDGRRDAAAARLAAFEARATAFLVRLGRTADDPFAGLDGLRRDLAAALAAAANQGRARQDLARIEAARAATVADLEAAAGRTATILAESGAADGPSLRAAVAEAAARREVEHEIRAARDTLLALSGPGEALEAFEADLASIADIGAVQAALAAIVERTRDLEGRRATSLEALGAEGRAIAEIERSAAAAELRQQRADRLTEMETLAEAWAVTTIALGLLRRTRSRYEREHRPDVLKEAEELLAAWTDGRYVRIHAPLGKQIQELERRDGVLVPLAGLSTGTAEQLYLAMRFGLVEHFGREAESLPVVMDDILVNFDPERAERAARSIEQLATRHQVLYFTCHPGTPLVPATTIELASAARS